VETEEEERIDKSVDKSHVKSHLIGDRCIIRKDKSHTPGTDA
jgi:hypothetical protein